MIYGQERGLDCEGLEEEGLKASQPQKQEWNWILAYVAPRNQRKYEWRPFHVTEP